MPWKWAVLPGAVWDKPSNQAVAGRAQQIFKTRRYNPMTIYIRFTTALILWLRTAAGAQAGDDANGPMLFGKVAATSCAFRARVLQPRARVLVSIWPAQSTRIVAIRIFGRKPGLEFRKRLGESSKQNATRNCPTGRRGITAAAVST